MISMAYIILFLIRILQSVGYNFIKDVRYRYKLCLHFHYIITKVINAVLNEIDNT